MLSLAALGYNPDKVGSKLQICAQCAALIRSEWSFFCLLDGWPVLSSPPHCYPPVGRAVTNLSCTQPILFVKFACKMQLSTRKVC